MDPAIKTIISLQNQYLGEVLTTHMGNIDLKIHSVQTAIDANSEVQNSKIDTLIELRKKQNSRLTKLEDRVIDQEKYCARTSTRFRLLVKNRWWYFAGVTLLAAVLVVMANAIGVSAMLPFLK